MTDAATSENIRPGAASFRLNLASPPGAAASSGNRRSVTETAVRPFVVFIVTCGMTFLLSFALLWAYVAAFPIAFLDRTYPEWLAKQALLERCSPGAIAVFGDSRALAGVMPKVMSIQGGAPVLNLGVSGSSPIETFFAVRRALACPTPPRLVVIAHSAMKYAGDSDFWHVGVRAGILDYDEVRRIEHKAHELGDLSSIDFGRADGLPSRLHDWLYTRHFPPYYFDSLVHGYGAGRWKHNIDAEAEILASSGQALFGTASGSSAPADEAAADDFKASPIVDLYFKRTLALLQAKHVAVLVMTMPMNEATYRRMPPKLADQLATYLRMRMDGISNGTLIEPIISCWPNSYYGDAWHFNASGSAAFSKDFSTFLSASLGGNRNATLPNRCPTMTRQAARGNTELRAE